MLLLVLAVYYCLSGGFASSLESKTHPLFWGQEFVTAIDTLQVPGDHNSGKNQQICFPWGRLIEVTNMMKIAFYVYYSL